MQVVSQALMDTIERDVSLSMYSHVVAEWELNSFYDVTVTGSDSEDDEYFPLESVIKPRRPVWSGLPKGIVDQSRAQSAGVSGRPRTVGSKTSYRYWHSNAMSDGTGVIATQTISLVYDVAVPCNKLVAGFEVSWAAPTEVTVSITTDGTTWDVVGTFIPGSDGRVDLYRQSDGTWSQVVDNDIANQAAIRGMRIAVSELNQPNSGLSVIQVSPRLVFDMTDRIIDVSIASRAEDYEFTHPVGRAASRTADVSIDNADRMFDEHNTESVLHGLMDKNVRLDIADRVLRNDGSVESVAQGVFFTESWSLSDDGVVTTEATDRSKFLQEELIENSFYWRLPMEHVIPDIIERFGHPNYVIRTAADDGNLLIPYVFFKNDQTVWEALQSLATADQAMFYFDEHDRFVWQSRDYVWQNDTPVWTVRNHTDGLNLPNVFSLDHQFSLGANRVNVEYTPLEPATSASGDIVNNVVWEQNEDLVLQSTPLASNVSTTDTQLNVDASVGRLMAREGIINVGGEFMRYERSSNFDFILHLRERGLYGSKVKAHSINPAANFWSFYTHRNNTQKINGNNAYGTYTVSNSLLTINAHEDNHRTISHFIGGTLNDSYRIYGCEMIFPVSRKADGTPYYHGRGLGGLFFNSNASREGYYFELMTTQEAVKTATRKMEARAWKRSSDGSMWHFFPVGTKGEPGKRFDVVPGRRYRLEVYYRASDRTFSFYVNGVGIMTFQDTDTSAPRPLSGYWGVFARYKSRVRFESVYAIDRLRTEDELADYMPSIWDRVEGGYISALLESQWRRYNRRYSDVVFEDFGPYVQEAVEFDVNYEISPNNETDLFMSADDSLYEVFHDRDPFRSRFVIVNRKREPVVVAGTDPRTDAKMSLFIYGRPIIEGEPSSVTVEDKLALIRRGAEEMDISSPWIQTKARAQRIADWLISRWAATNDIITVNVIVTPFLQLGDLVQLSLPDQHLNPATHQYNIVGIDKTVGSNHDMTLTLRRRR